MSESAHEIMTLLGLAAHDPGSEEELYRKVEQRFRAIAAKLLRGQSPAHTFQPTLLADDAFLKLMRGSHQEWTNREQFFGMAARVMRQLLVDHARQKCAEKRNQNERPAGLDAVAEPADVRAASPERLLQIAELFEELRQEHPEPFQVFELHYFSGWELQEIAEEILNVSYPTVKRRWQVAKAFLRERLGADGDESDG